jgi:hypothetical protein
MSIPLMRQRCDFGEVWLLERTLDGRALDSTQHRQEAVLRAAGAAWPGANEPGMVAPDVADTLRKLADLRDAGVLSEDEFRAKKAQILASA